MANIYSYSQAWACRMTQQYQYPMLQTATSEWQHAGVQEIAL